jgi:hypothetical protein
MRCYSKYRALINEKNEMKKIVLILAFIAANLGFVKAQEGDEPKAEKIQALKIAFITQKLGLSSTEAQRFWPVYDRYEIEMRQALKDNQSDVIDNDERILNIRKRYRSEFSNVLGQDRVNTLFRSENEFRGVLMRRLKNRQQQRPMERPHERPMWKRR